MTARGQTSAAGAAAGVALGTADTAAIEAFLEMAAAERGLARNTIDAYRRDLACFAAHLAPSRVALAEAETASIRGFMAAQRRSGISARSAARRLSCLRQFYRFLLTDGRRDDDPTGTVDSPTLPRTLPGVLTEEEVGRLLAVAWPEDGAAEASHKREADGLRLRAMIELLYGSGLRVSELVSLPLHAASAESRTLLVRGKGDKERLVPLGVPARRALDAYLAARERHLVGGAPSRWPLAEDMGVAGRFDYSGMPGLMLGLSAYSGQTAQGGEINGQPVGGRVRIWDAHFDYEIHGWDLRALVAGAHMSDVAAMNALIGLEGAEGLARDMLGWYAQAGYDVLRASRSTHQLIPYVRYERVNTQRGVAAGFSADPANDVTVTSMGAAWKPATQVVAKLGYQIHSTAADTGVNQVNFSLGWLF